MKRRLRKGHVRLRRGARLFGPGWQAFAVALVSPLHEAGERSFTMHMIGHELIMLVAAPAARDLGHRAGATTKETPTVPQTRRRDSCRGDRVELKLSASWRKGSV